MPLVALLLLSATLSAPPRVWNDSIRDVYIDGKLQRGAQTLTTSSRMVAVVCGEDVLLFDPDKGVVSRAPKSQFAFAPDRTSATTDAQLAPAAAGTLVRPDASTLLATVGESTVLVAAHQSRSGPMTIEELYATAPVWRAIADVYEPDGAIVERLRAIDAPVTLDVVLATWCGDSRQHVPRLLKSIARAANPNITVTLTGIGPEFLEPMSSVVADNVTNVPTVIVRRGGRELGRFVETPANGTVEADIADIALGTPKAHPGRWERGALLATGTYLLRDAKRRHEGTERFELYDRPGGGTVAHSVIARSDGTSVETWAAVDADRRPRLLEVTWRGETTTRTRFRRSGETWSAVSRGAAGGIIEQHVRAPEAFVAPATITYAWARGASATFVVPERGMGEARAAKFSVAAGDVPGYVRLEDGSERRLITRR